MSFLSFVGARFYHVTQERLLPKDRMTPIQMDSDGLNEVWEKRGGYYDIIGSSAPRFSQIGGGKIGVFGVPQRTSIHWTHCIVVLAKEHTTELHFLQATGSFPPS